MCARAGVGLTLQAEGQRLALPTLVLYEWLRGPRVPEELAAQEALFPIDQALDFGTEEASIAARLYRELPNPRSREIDLAIAASALVWRCPLWTLNVSDFRGRAGAEAGRLIS